MKQHEDYPCNQAGLSAYVIFTSGSTGAPKGVEISRAALNHYVRWIELSMAPSTDDRWSQHPSIGFDLSVLDVFGALCFGATLVPLTRSADRLLPATAIQRNELTIWNSVPSIIDLMAQADQLDKEHLSSLRLLSYCGEPLYSHQLEDIFAAVPNVNIHQTYGPSEATVSMTLLQLHIKYVCILLRRLLGRVG